MNADIKAGNTDFFFRLSSAKTHASIQDFKEKLFIKLNGTQTLRTHADHLVFPPFENQSKVAHSETLFFYQESTTGSQLLLMKNEHSPSNCALIREHNLSINLHRIRVEFLSRSSTLHKGFKTISVFASVYTKTTCVIVNQWMDIIIIPTMLGGIILHTPPRLVQFNNSTHQSSVQYCRFLHAISKSMVCWSNRISAP